MAALDRTPRIESLTLKEVNQFAHGGTERPVAGDVLTEVRPGTHEADQEIRHCQVTHVQVGQGPQSSGDGHYKDDEGVTPQTQ